LKLPSAALGRGARALAVVGVVFALLCGRALYSTHVELSRAESLHEGGNNELAVDHYRRAATWMFPGNVRARQALESLIEIGVAAEARGESVLALAAFRSVHAAVMSTRSFYEPNADLRELADTHIAHLMSVGVTPPMDAHLSPDEREATYLAMLRENRDVSLLWAWVALLGFIAWVSGAWLFAARAIDTAHALIPSEARRWSTLFVVGFGAFVLGLALA
jgi:hypothetical protein